jgi:hypothetical protein
MRFAAIDVKIAHPLLYHVLLPLTARREVGGRGVVEGQARRVNTTATAAKWQ